jgi:hypothetical protein
MFTQPHKSIEQGWEGMQNERGRFHHSNKQLKQRSRQGLELNAKPEASSTMQLEGHVHGGQQGPRSHSTESSSAAVVSSAPFQNSHETGRPPHHRHLPNQKHSEGPSGQRQIKICTSYTSDAILTPAVMKLTASPPIGVKGLRPSATIAASELELLPIQVADTSDNNGFIDDVPISFARQRNTYTSAKPLGLVVEDASASHTVANSESEPEQLVAIRKYFQELDHLSERPSKVIVESGVPSKVASPVVQLMSSDDLRSISAPLQDPHSDFASTGVSIHLNESSADHHSTHLSSYSASHEHQDLRDVHVSGASGVFADFVNGVYEPTSERCCGMTVYHKRDDNDKWLEYSNKAHRWTILDTAHRGQIWGWAFLTTHRSIEKCSGLTGWKISDGSRHVDDLNIRCHIVEKSALRSDFELKHNLHSSNSLLDPATHALGSSLVPKISSDPVNSARGVSSVWNASTHRTVSEVVKPLPPFHALNIIQQLERTLVKQRAVEESSPSSIQHKFADMALTSYGQISRAIIRLQARYRGQRVRKALSQNRLHGLIRDLSMSNSDSTSPAPAQADKAECSPQHRTSARMFGAVDAVDLDDTLLASGKRDQSTLENQESVTLSLDNHVSSVFHPVHNTSSKNRSAINAIVRNGVNSEDMDVGQLLLILKKSKLFKHRKVADRILPNASICCELVDFAVITFQLESRQHAVQLFQKLVDSNHLKLPHTLKIFKDEHSFVFLPRHESDQLVKSGASLNMNSDFSVVVESIWRDNNMRIACSIVTDVMNNRDPRASYEGWRSTLHDIAYSKGLRAVMFLFLLAHVGLGFFMTREINWTGSCRDHPSEVNRVRFVLSIESGFCAVYVLYMTIRILAGFPKSLRFWFFFESAIIIIMWADLGYSHGIFDDHNVPIRFSLPLRALMITCWSHRLRTHLHEIYLSVRKLKVLGGAVFLWIIITATLITIYVRVICANSTTENTCRQLNSVYFDNAATSMVTLAIMMTTSNYGTISQLFLNRPGQSTTGIILVFLGLIIFMVISYFLLLSMMLAIVFDAFKKGKKEIMSEKADIFDAALIGAFSLLCERDSMSIKHDTYRRFMRMLIPNISADRLKKYWEFLDADKNGSIALDEFLELSTIVSFQVFFYIS